MERLNRIIRSYILLALALALHMCQCFAYYIPPYVDGPRNVYYCTGDGDRLFSGRPVGMNQDDWSAPYCALRDAYQAQGYRFIAQRLPQVITDEFAENALVIYQHNVPHPASFDGIDKIAHKMVIIAIEPPHVLPGNSDVRRSSFFPKILTWDDTRVDNKRFFKYHVVQSRLQMIAELVPFAQKKLCTLIASNKDFGADHPDQLYRHRRTAIDFFERHAPQEFDFYGPGWDPRRYTTYRGVVARKTETLKQYKFSICYENICGLQGYITEKIFGSFVAGCVPIYWGAANVTDYIPKGCFIDRRDFASLDGLYAYISSMQELAYNQYLENIRAFLSSEVACKYSIDAFVRCLTHVAHGKRKREA